MLTGSRIFSQTDSKLPWYGEVFLHRFPLCILQIYLVPAVWQESSCSRFPYTDVPSVGKMPHCCLRVGCFLYIPPVRPDNLLQFLLFSHTNFAFGHKFLPMETVFYFTVSHRGASPDGCRKLFNISFYSQTRRFVFLGERSGAFGQDHTGNFHRLKPAAEGLSDGWRVGVSRAASFARQRAVFPKKGAVIRRAQFSRTTMPNSPDFGSAKQRKSSCGRTYSASVKTSLCGRGFSSG